MRAAVVVAGAFLIAWMAVAPQCEAQSSRTSSKNSGRVTSRSGSQTSSSATNRLSTSSGGLESAADQAMTSTQFLRSTRGANNFVGADRNDIRDFTGLEGDLGDSSSGSRRGSISNRGTTRLRSSGQNNTNLNQRNLRSTASRNRNGATGRTSAHLQPTMALGFDSTAPSQTLQTVLTGRLQQSKGFATAPAVKMRVEGGVVILSGTVASEHDRALAEQLLALEPGVRRVDNQLMVGVSPSDAKPAGP